MFAIYLTLQSAQAAELIELNESRGAVCAKPLYLCIVELELTLLLGRVSICVGTLLYGID